MRTRLTPVILLLSLLATTVCHATDAIVLKGAGATFPYPLYAKWFADYGKIDPELAFDYQKLGSGGGIREIMARTVDFGASDKFLSDAELQAAPGKLLHIPTVMGAVAIVYNLPGIAGKLKLTPDVLADLFLGKITRWNDARIVTLNRGVNIPDQPVTVVRRSDGSGTTSILTDYLSEVNRDWAARVGKGTTVPWPVGIGAKGSDGIVAELQRTPYSISYVELAYALENQLPFAALRNRNGKFVNPSILTTRAAAVGALKRIPADYRISLVNQPGKDAYPIVGFTWLLVYQQQADHLKGKKLVDFLEWQLRKGEKLTPTLLYTPLPKALADRVDKTIRSIN